MTNDLSLSLSNWGETLICRGLKQRKLVDYSESDSDSVMGRGLARRLESKGIRPIITPETDLDKAVTAYLAGSLVVMTPEEVEHHHDHEEGHAHEDKCGCNQA